MQKTHNFIVSRLNSWSNKGLENLLINPYLLPYFDRSTARLVDDPRPDEISKQRAYEQVNEYYTNFKYSLARALNKYHGFDFPQHFWDKFFCFFLYRLISSLYDRFIVFENNFDLKKSYFKCLKNENFIYPTTAADGRHLLAASDLMQEQLFTLYIECFYPDQQIERSELSAKDEPFERGKGSGSSRQKKFYEKFTKEVLLRKFFHYKFKNVKAKIHVTNSDFDIENMDFLYSKSGGQIVWQPNERPVLKMAADHQIRCGFKIQSPADSTRFLKFLSHAAPYLLPTTFLENFPALLEYYRGKVNPSLKYIISESWLNDEFLSLYLALSREKGIKHIYNQHGLEEPLTRCMSKFSANLCDTFLSLGWQENEYTNLISGAYLRKIEKTPKQRDPMILNVAYFGEPYLVEVSSTDIYTGFSAQEYVGFKEKFLANLPEEVIGKITYKPYPVLIPLNTWDLTKYHGKYISKMQPYGFSGTLKEAMQLASLTIIDTVGSVFCEALIQNSPFVLLCHAGIEIVKDKYKNEFQRFEQVGIFQTDAIEAASFIAKISSDPLGWWYSSEVQSARDEYVKNHYGDLKKTLNYLVQLSCE